jgi:Methyltransferase domain
MHDQSHLPVTADWDARFAGEDYLFGTAPADFIPRRLGLISPGSRLLSVAEGEGRNAVALAEAGHDVVGFEASPVALDKARRLAAAKGVAPDLRQASVQDWDWAPEAFDVGLGIFIQFAGPALRAEIHRGLARTIKPGGLVMLHGYAPRQIGFATGGPRALENLYTLEALSADFPGWRIVVAADYDAEIHEGRGHDGISALIDFVAEKP